MQIDDLRTMPSDVGIEADLCIVGSGPAGLTIAQELAGSGIRVLIIESGGLVRQPEADALDEIESVGVPRVREQWDLRNRIFGGSSHTWSGRCAPFDDIDYEERPWVPYSGWPIGAKDMVPFLDRTVPYLGLGLGSGFSGDGFWQATGQQRPRSDIDESLLRPFFWQISQDAATRFDFMRFGPRALNLPAPNVKAIVNATVTHINTDPAGSRVESLEIASPENQRRTVRTRTVVVCAGGIENARLLLASNRIVAAGLGNRHDMVGRFLMDHRRGEIGTFDPKASADIRDRFANYLYKSPNGTHSFIPGLALSSTIQRDEGLLNCAVWVNEVRAPDDPWDALKRLVRRKGQLGRDLGTVAANLDLLAQGVRRSLINHRGLPHKSARVELQCMIEQTPDPDSRITLGDRKDRLGMPIIRIDWRISDQEQRTVRRAAQLVVQEFKRVGLTPPTLEEWARIDSPTPIDLPHIAHPTGATRMSSDPRFGVVDADCQVHGVDGLFVSGSSVFPTGSHANPTQLIVGMAIRLADKLKSRSRDEAMPVMVHSTGNIGPEPAARPRVLVTGASGRIGRHLVPELLARGYSVRALTSRPQAQAPDGPAGVEWRHHDFLESLDFEPHMAGCGAVLHLGAEIVNIPKMHRVNVEATQALARAAENAGVRYFCYTSSIAVYGTTLTRTVTEDSPVVTPDRAVPGEFWTEERAQVYGRTKLAGELALRQEARAGEYVIFRPTSVIDVPDLIEPLNWGMKRKMLLGHRHTHHIYVRDVVNAVVWFMERSLARDVPEPGVSLFNLADDDAASGTYADFFRKAYQATGDKRFACPVQAPWVLDYLRQVAQYRRWPLRVPRGIVVFPPDRLYATGYRHRFGMAKAQELAIKTLDHQPRIGGVALEH
jgi:choline dehydrogenase-like flavoprotein/nucleoside-diphosphate-sugar epimerase